MIDIEQLIEKYKMTEDEAHAMRLCLIWEKFTNEVFPKEKISKIPKKGDPRKGFLFKCCYKLTIETRGIIKEDEYKFYILAQLQIMKSLKKGEVHPLIDPVILVGDKAWVRWRMWCNHCKKLKKKSQSADEVGVRISDAQIKYDLQRTKEFLISQFNKIPDVGDLEPLVSDLTLVRWASLGKISPFYILMSPTISKVVKIDFDRLFSFDFDVYKSSITKYIKDYYQSEFIEEFKIQT